MPVVLVLAALAALLFASLSGGTATVGAQAPPVCAPAVSLPNGGFEEPDLSTRTPFGGLQGVYLLPQDDVPGWSTTASDGIIEMWRVPNFQGVPAASGIQFAELNANLASTLFQEVSTTPGQTVSWSLAHRGRLGPDTMALQIGPPGGAPSFSQQFTDGNGAWGRYSGTYTVPAGQTTTRVAFVAVSATGGQPDFGNFLDDIAFSAPAVPCTPTPLPTATATPGPSAVPTETPVTSPTETPGATNTPGPGRGPNRRPDARPDEVRTFQGVEVTLDVLANDSDPDGDALKLVYAAPGARGQVFCTEEGLCTYAPDPGFVGTDSFPYAIADQVGDTRTTRVTVVVEASPTPTPGPNRPPVALGDLVSTRQEVPVTIDILANDADPDRDPLTVAAASEPERGTVTCLGTRPTLCTYTPEAEFTGNDAFSYTVIDGRGGVATARVSVSVLRPVLPVEGDTISLP